MSGEKKGIVQKAKDLVNKARKTVKKIINAIKFFMTPLGTVLGWLLLIILAVILLYVVVNIVATAFKEWLGLNTDYMTYDKDLQVIQDLYASGYASQVDPENFVNFKAFEYSVLIDAAEYIRTQGQERFDLIENQGIYTKERDLYIKKYGGVHEYLKARGLDNEPENPAITLLTVNSTTNQSNIDKDILKQIVNKASGGDVRNINVVEEAGRVEESGETKGGNNRVNGPFLVYEFVYSELTKSTSGDSTTNSKNQKSISSTNINANTNTNANTSTNPSENTSEFTTNTGEGLKDTVQIAGENGISYAEVPISAMDKFGSGELGGSVIPYIYVIREEIDYDFYFDENNDPIEIPLLLNAFNSDLELSIERSKEINRATGNLPVKVWPDLSVDKEEGVYTWVPYYSDETNCTIYKIPLKTIIGRYMPRTELLHTWTLLKQNISQNRSLELTDENLKIINGVTDKIKQIYSDVCLDGETTQTHTETVTEKKINDKNEVEDVTNTYTYEEDLTNTKSFVTFEKAGIETTRYIEFKNEKKKLSYVTGFSSAVSVPEEFSIKYKLIPPEFKKIDVDGTTQTTESLSTNNKWLETTMNISELRISGLEKKVQYIPAYGTPEDGYSPPASLHDYQEGYLYNVGENQIPVLKKIILDAACEKLGADVNTATIDIDIKYSPVFHTKKLETAKVLEIEHRRMPVLLVKSATTWARNIEYTHLIKQEMFEPTDPSYLVPKCVSSMGIHTFTTSENSGAYRGKAYEEIFGFLQEKDVVSMLLNLETFADQGIEDCYEYMRELYKLVMAAQNYSQTASQKINPGTYTYVHLQNSILYYNDRQSQAIYWQELLGQRGPVDALVKDEVENVRTRDPDIKWQILEYNKYEECRGKVYALNPYGSGYVRAYQQQAKTQSPDDPEINGAYSPGSHEGADLYGRNRIDSMLQQGGSATDDYVSVTRKIFNYGLKQLESIYTPQKAKEYFIKRLKEELSYMPIVAVAPGKVEEVGFNGRSGFFVSVQHDKEGTSTLYCHLKRWPNVAKNDYIGAGTVIGYEGNTGRSGATHLHFEIHKNNATAEERATGNPDTNTVDPQYYIFPTFNPFYYEEKLAEEGLSLSSEYMTLYRTVYMADISGAEVGSGDLKRTKPNRPLLENANNLILEQGKKELAINMTGDLGWAETERNDLYIRKEFFDITLAQQKGLLNADSDLLAVLYGYIPVKTDMAGGLPALTREELEYILKNWLSSRYSEAEFNWLMKNVFTEDTIAKILAAQEEYKVSAVFALAVGTLEQQLGIAYYRDNTKILGKPDICNIFSIKGSGVSYIEAEWNKYDSYGDAFTSFARLIAGKNYFEAGKFTIAAIGPTYCPTGNPPGSNWSNQVTSLVMEIMRYYTGSKWSMPGNSLWFGYNGELINAINNMMAWMNRGGSNQYYYCRTGNTGFPPYNVKRGEYVEDFSMLEPRSRKGICGQTCSDQDYPDIVAPRTHCNYYVEVCLWQMARAKGLTDTEAKARYVKGGSSAWEGYGDYLAKQPNQSDGIFQVVWYGDGQPGAASKDKAQILGRIQAGDVLVYGNVTRDKEGSSSTNWNPGHVEFYVGKENDKASFENYKRGSSKWLETEKYEIYSNGLEKKSIDSAFAFNGESTYLKSILRPLPIK